MIRSVYLLTLVFLVTTSSFSQVVINGYAEVTAISGNSLTLGAVDQTAHQFVVGEMLVITQIQDDVIGANTNNDSQFGDLSSIQSAGLYEVRMIASINGNSTPGFSSASPTTIDVVSLNNTYNTGANSSVQVITFRQMSAADYTTTGNISALDWNGTIGGVLAMYVPGTLTLNHSISVNAQGFRGGNRSIDHHGPVCNSASTTRYRENNNQLGFKGEGIYKIPIIFTTTEELRF